MRWNRPVSGVGPGQSRLVIVTVIVVAVMIPVLLSVGAGDQKRISIYSGSANYTLNVQEPDGKEYVDLLEILQPLGATSIKSDRSSWRLRFGNTESEFIPEKARARIRGSDFDLPGKFKLENGRGLVPLGSQTLTFDSKIIPSANYAESNGAAEIAVNSSVPLLASFSNDGRTITIAPAPQRQLQTSIPAPEQQT